MKNIDFFKLIRGSLTVIKGGKKIAELSNTGEYFGEVAAITGEVRSASVVSQGRSIVKRFPGEKINEIIEKHPDISSKIFKSLATRLKTSNQIILNLASAQAKKRRV